MKQNAGYNLLLEGRPSDEVQIPPEPEILHLPLWSRRFTFTEIEVTDGERVRQGQVLARDPKNHAIPLLAPREGTVRPGKYKKHLTMEDIELQDEEPFEADEKEVEIPEGISFGGMERYKLLELGAWQFFQEARTGRLPNPLDTPTAIVVNTLGYEPYTARGEVITEKRSGAFLNGLKCLSSIFEGVTLYLALRDEETGFKGEPAGKTEGLNAFERLEVPSKYPQDNPALLARRAGINLAVEKVWNIDAAGVLAINRAENFSLPATVRIISLGGPPVKRPTHLKAVTGYPLEKILEGRLEIQMENCRIVNGGVFTGDEVEKDMMGLPAECTGLTVVEEQKERKFLAFLRPGIDRRSYSRTFLSSLRPGFTERLDTGKWGENRPCVCCGYCERVCPAGIMPNLIHRHLYGDDIEEAERLRLDLCVGCGLCSYVCPSKIDLREQILKTQQELRHEHEMAEASDVAG